jgi:hypothetical protein
LTEVRAEFHNGRGLAPTGRSRFHENVVGNLAGTAETLLVSEAVVASESTDRLALALDMGQRRMCRHGIAKFLKFAVYGPFPQRGLKGLRVKKNIDVFRKPLNQVPSFRQAGAALEDDHVFGDGPGNSPQRFGDVVVFLDDRRPQSLLAKVLRRLEHGLLEIAMLKQSHAGEAP